VRGDRFRYRPISPRRPFWPSRPYVKWPEVFRFALASIIAPDGLHMTDASYACLANEAAEALARN
jgi:hypothetical protein